MKEAFLKQPLLGERRHLEIPVRVPLQADDSLAHLRNKTNSHFKESKSQGSHITTFSASILHLLSKMEKHTISFQYQLLFHLRRPQ